MSAKASYTAASLLSLLIASAGFGQTPASAPNAPEGVVPQKSYVSIPPGYPGPIAMPTVAGPDGTPVGEPTAVPDPYIAYPQPYCCGPVGGSGPILMELYTRIGPAIPLASHSITHALGTGWEIQAGGRSLFFNVPRDRAWFVDLGAANAYNHASDNTIPFNLLGKKANITSVNRTFVNIGLGEEHWMRHPVNCCGGDGWNWRWGYDGGFRYGTVRVDNVVPASIPDNPSGYARLNSRMYGVYAALHSDIELPRGCCTFIFGTRLEWQYDWIGTYGSMSDIQGLNILFTAGVRF